MDFIKRTRAVSQLIEKRKIAPLAMFFNTTERTIQKDIFLIRKLGAKLKYNTKKRCYLYIEDFDFDTALTVFFENDTSILDFLENEKIAESEKNQSTSG